MNLGKLIMIFTKMGRQDLDPRPSSSAAEVSAPAGACETLLCGSENCNRALGFFHRIVELKSRACGRESSGSLAPIVPGGKRRDAGAVVFRHRRAFIKRQIFRVNSDSPFPVRKLGSRLNYWVSNKAAEESAKERVAC